MTLRQPCTSSKTTRVFCGFKKLFVLFVFIKVEISSVFAAAFSKFFQNSGLAHLAHAFQNQRLAIGRIDAGHLAPRRFVMRRSRRKFITSGQLQIPILHPAQPAADLIESRGQYGGQHKGNQN